MKREDFIAASISTRIYEEDLIKNFESLIDRDSLEEVLDALRDSVYGKSIEELNRPEDYEIILDRELRRVYEKVADISPDKNLFNFLIEKYNFHNLKVLVKEIIAEADFKSLYSDMANIDIDLIRKEILSESTESDYYIDSARRSLKAYEETKDPAAVDISLDKSYYQRRLDLAEKTGLESLIDFQKEEVDLININTLLRVKSQDLGLERLRNSLIDGCYIDNVLDMFSLDINGILIRTATSKVHPYLERALDPDKDLSENLLDLEKAIDDHFMDFTRDSKLITYGPEVLLSYVIAKEIEIKNLRIIFISKLNSLSKDFTLERLRDHV